MKDILSGLWSLLMLTAEFIKDWWVDANSTKRSIVTTAVILIFIFGYVTCARAAPTDDSNWSVVQVVDSSLRLMCYQEAGAPITGLITICLQGVQTPLGENYILFNGMQAYCAVIGLDPDENLPVWDCAETHKEMTQKLIGI